MPTVPFVDLRADETLKSELRAAFEDVLASGHYELGPNVAAFEQEYALHTGTAHSVGVASGLSALELCLEVLGIGPGDEVLAPSNTYIATILAISHRGATPEIGPGRLSPLFRGS